MKKPDHPADLFKIDKIKKDAKKEKEKKEKMKEKEGKQVKELPVKILGLTKELGDVHFIVRQDIKHQFNLYRLDILSMIWKYSVAPSSQFSL